MSANRSHASHPTRSARRRRRAAWLIVVPLLVLAPALLAGTPALASSTDPSQTTDAWTVSYTVGGTASPDTDYVALSGNVVIPAGQASATINVTAIADDLVEGNETVVVTLQPTAKFSPGQSASAMVTIMDKPMVQIVATDAIASEADVSDTGLFTVFRDPGQSGAEWTVP